MALGQVLLQQEEWLGGGEDPALLGRVCLPPSLPKWP